MEEENFEFKPSDLDKKSIRAFYSEGHSNESIFDDALRLLVKLCPTEQYGEDEDAAALQDLIGEHYFRIEDLQKENEALKASFKIAESNILYLSDQIEGMLKGTVQEADRKIVKFIFDVDWMGTKEFCEFAGFPVPYFSNDKTSIELANDFIRVDAIRWKRVIEFAKDIKRNRTEKPTLKRLVEMNYEDFGKIFDSEGFSNPMVDKCISSFKSLAGFHQAIMNYGRFESHRLAVELGYDVEFTLDQNNGKESSND